jgi:hypothetical protein
MYEFVFISAFIFYHMYTAPGIYAATFEPEYGASFEQNQPARSSQAEDETVSRGPIESSHMPPFQSITSQPRYKSQQNSNRLSQGQNSSQRLSVAPTVSQDSPSSIQIILKLMAELFGGNTKSSKEQMKSQCASLAEIEKYLNENPEHKAEAEKQLAAFKIECSRINADDTNTSSNSYHAQSDGALGPNNTPRSCKPKVDAATDKIISNNYLLTVYKDAAKKEGIDWKILAAIHYLEAGSNARLSLISGRPLGTPEPDNGGKIYSSLYETAVDAAKEYKRSKLPIAMSISGKDANHIETLAAAFGLYNGAGNKQCQGQNPKPLAPGYTACPPAFNFHDHIYPMSCFDDEHETMYVIYCGDGRQCNSPTRYQNVGALTLMRALDSRQETDRTDESSDAHTRKDQLSVISNWTYYPQCNGSIHSGPWADIDMIGSNGQSIGCSYCKASCGLAASAMIVTSYTKQSVDPTQFLKQYNQTQSMTCGGAFLPTLGTTLKKYGVTVGGHIPFNRIPLTDSLFIQKARSYLQNGWTLLTLGYRHSSGKMST